MLTWEQAFYEGPKAVGGKGWNLGRLARYGFAVPRGGVVAASVYEDVIDRPEFAARLAAVCAIGVDRVADDDIVLQLDDLRQQLVETSLPNDARSSIEQFMQQHDLLERPVAVRSSAVAEDGGECSFAGIHESYLNVRGLDAICAAVMKCYASLWTAHALAYRRRFQVEDRDCPCAVVVCEMVGDEVNGPVAAGVAFSCEPVTGQRHLTTINLASGLGDAVVRGTVDPQQYCVQFADGGAKIERKDKTGGDAILDHAQIAELAKLVNRVYWALGGGRQPQDIEWAFDGVRFWTLQARPVTQLPRWTFPGTKHRPPIWSNANVRDSFPNPLTTMTWSFIESSAQNIVYASLRVMGYPIPDGMEILRCFAGRAYFDLDGLQWSMYDSMGLSPAETNRTMGGFQPEIDVPPGNPLRGRAGWQRLLRRFRFLGRLRRFHKDAPKKIDAMIDAARQARDRDLSSLSDCELLAEFRRIQALGGDYQPNLQIAAAFYGGWMILMQDLLEKTTGDRAQSLVTRLLASSGDVASAEQSYRLGELAQLAAGETAALESLDSTDPFAWRALSENSQFRAAMQDYLDDFGHRAVFEMEIASRRWCEDPTYLLDQIRFHVDHLDRADQRAHAADVRRQAEQQLGNVPWYIRPVVRWMLGRTRLGAGLRENAKSGSAASVALVRYVCLEIGRRMQTAGELAAADDVFHLGIAEVEAYLEGTWNGAGARWLVEDRQAQISQDAQATLPGVIVDEADIAAPPPVSSHSAADESTNDNTWPGVAAAPGQATGPACVLHSPHDGGRMRQGDILVAPSTDPGWTPLFLRASAVVMETGGYLSHGAIVAREFGLPAVVNVEQALSNIRDGDALNVNGDEGTVKMLRKESNPEA